jgi:hypothetical protein
VAWEIVLLEPVDTWFLKLCESDPGTAALVEQAIDRLATAGPTLGRPLVDTLEHSSLRNLKELRPGSRGRSEIRILFVFDPDRRPSCSSPVTRRAAGPAGIKRRFR